MCRLGRVLLDYGVCVCLFALGGLGIGFGGCFVCWWVGGFVGVVVFLLFCCLVLSCGLVVGFVRGLLFALFWVCCLGG